MTEMNEPLKFDAAALTAFDAPPPPDDFDLSSFDAASGDTTIPAGDYLCKLSGKLKTTNNGEPDFLLQFEIVHPPEHAGAKVWDTNILTPSWYNTTKAKLARLGLTTQAQLKKGYPSEGEEVFCECKVTRKEDPEYGWRNRIQRFKLCPPPEAAAEQPADDTATVNPFAVPLPEVTK